MRDYEGKLRDVRNEISNHLGDDVCIWSIISNFGAYARLSAWQLQKNRDFTAAKGLS
jgi:hypothetical protein